MTDESSRECGGEVNHSSSMSNSDPSRAALADELAERFADRCFDPGRAGEGASYPSVLAAIKDAVSEAMTDLALAPSFVSAKTVERILFAHFYTGEPGEHGAIKEATAALNALLPGRLDSGALVNALKEIEALGAHGETAARLGNIAHAALIAFYTLPPTLNSGAVTIKPRRLFEEHRPDGMMESDRDFMDNNREACVAFLESAALPSAVEGGADREKVCAHESCLNCVCPERNFCTGTYYRVLSYPNTGDGK